MSDLMKQLGYQPADASTGPGTRVLKPGEDFEDVLGQYSDDPTERPIFSSHPLNMSLADRLKVAARDRRQFDIDQKEQLGDIGRWLNRKWLFDQSTEPRVEEPPGFDADEMFEKGYSQIVHDQNSTIRMEEHLNNLNQSGKISDEQYTQMMRILDQFRRGTDSQIKALSGSIGRELIREVPVLKGKRRL